MSIIVYFIVLFEYKLWGWLAKTPYIFYVYVTLLYCVYVFVDREEQFQKTSIRIIYISPNFPVVEDPIHCESVSLSNIMQASCAAYRSRLATIFSERELTFTFAICYRPSVCLSVCRLSVCNVRAPYSGGSDFRQYFYGIMYLGHPRTSIEHFTEIVPGEPLRRGS